MILPPATQFFQCSAVMLLRNGGRDCWCLEKKHKANYGLPTYSLHFSPDENMEACNSMQPIPVIINETLYQGP